MRIRPLVWHLISAWLVVTGLLAQESGGGGAGDPARQPDGVREVRDDQGVLVLRETYVGGRLEGAFFERDPESGRTREGRYRHGHLDGVVTVKLDRKTLSKQSWKRGQLERLDRLRHPFPVAKSDLLTKIGVIEQLDADRSGRPTEADALRRLQAYRFLCGVPWEGMQLVEEWNLDCAAAARVSQLNRGISHTPSRPEGISDELWQRAVRGSRSSNLAAGSGMVGQVDSYMDDSDRSNIERVGHRRWCLNPGMRKTGFGAAGGYGAMWSFDQSGRGAKGMDAVFYPPRGYVPVDYFASHHAWSVALLSGGRPDVAELRVDVFALDEHYVREAEPQPLKYLGVAAARQGTGPCIIFLPADVVVQPGRAYLVEIAFDGGKKADLTYLVEFCEAARSRS